MPQPILCPVRNNLHLTRKAIKTFRDQDIAGGVNTLVVGVANYRHAPKLVNTLNDAEDMAATLKKLGVAPNNGIGDLYAKIKALPDAERAAIEADAHPLTSQEYPA